MFKKYVKLICTVLVLALSFSACHIKTPDTVGTIDGKEISAGIYLLHQLDAYNAADSIVGADTDNLLSATVEGKTGAQYIEDETLTALRRYIWIENNAPEDLLSAEELAQSIENASFNYEYLQEAYSANGIGQNSYETYYLTDAKFNALYTQYSEEEGEGISVDDAMDYMNEVYKNLNTLVFPGVNADGSDLTDEQTQSIAQIANDLIEDLQNGGAMDEEGKAALEEAAEIAGIEVSDDLMTQYNTTALITDESAELYYSDEEAQLFQSASEGDVMLSPSQDVIAVYQFIPNFEDEDEFETSYYDAIISEITYDMFNEKIETESLEYVINFDESAISTYSAKNIV